VILFQSLFPIFIVKVDLFVNFAFHGKILYARYIKILHVPTSLKIRLDLQAKLAYDLYNTYATKTRRELVNPNRNLSLREL